MGESNSTIHDMVKKVWEGMLCNHSDHKILTLLHMYMHMLDTVLLHMLSVYWMCTIVCICAVPMVVLYICTTVLTLGRSIVMS